MRVIWNSNIWQTVVLLVPKQLIKKWFGRMHWMQLPLKIREDSAKHGMLYSSGLVSTMWLFELASTKWHIIITLGDMLQQGNALVGHLYIYANSLSVNLILQNEPSTRARQHCWCWLRRSKICCAAFQNPCLYNWPVAGDELHSVERKWGWMENYQKFRNVISNIIMLFTSFLKIKARRNQFFMRSNKILH